MNNPSILLEQPSCQTLFLELMFEETLLSTASGFLVKRPNGSPLLITNWHVVSGRNPITKELLDEKHASIPNVVRIAHNEKDLIGKWVCKIERLYDAEGKSLWLEEPVHGSEVDVVGLPLHELEGVDMYPYSYSGATGHDVEKLPSPIKWGVSDFVNVIGFLFGWTGGGSLGIWVQGAVATEPALNYQGLPRYLIDSRTREGQSGSPVVFYKRNGWLTLTDVSPYMIHNPLTMLLGVYSGRLSKDSDLGTVWNTSVVKSIAEKGKPSNVQL